MASMKCLHRIVYIGKKNPYLAAIMYRVNAMPRYLSGKNGFSFISNDVITADYLWKDDVHLQGRETHSTQSFLNIFKYICR